MANIDHVDLQTNATNRRIREIITAVKNETLIPRPDFQRRLVWTNRDKLAFLDTILNHLPFPEIYVCAGEVNPETAQGTEWLVDGQQRVSTIYSYFTADPTLRLGTIAPYSTLLEPEKRKFLEYTVVVRDLGDIPLDTVKNIFQRINSTKYGLNAMELANARYDGAIKKVAEALAEHDFFTNHGVFRTSDVRRMNDVSFQLSVLITMEQGYFDDTSAHEEYLERYNDEYPLKENYHARAIAVFDFIDLMQLPAKGRWWKKADLFTLIVELDRALHERKVDVSADAISGRLTTFDLHLQRLAAQEGLDEFTEEYRKALSRYANAAAQGSNHRKSRTIRGSIMEILILADPQDDQQALFSAHGAAEAE
jgi:hypothetical protein